MFVAIKQLCRFYLLVSQVRGQMMPHRDDDHTHCRYRDVSRYPAYDLGDCLVLNLKYIKIGEEGGRELGKELVKNTMLKELHLFNANLGDEGVTALADSLKQNTALEELHLQRCQFGEKGMAAIANMLKYNKMIHTLVVKENGIGDHGAFSLAKALEFNTKLRTLELADDAIGEEGGRVLGKALRNHPEVTSLNGRNPKTMSEHYMQDEIRRISLAREEAAARRDKKESDKKVAKNPKKYQQKFDTDNPFGSFPGMPGMMGGMPGMMGSNMMAGNMMKGANARRQEL